MVWRDLYSDNQRIISEGERASKREDRRRCELALTNKKSHQAAAE